MMRRTKDLLAVGILATICLFGFTSTAKAVTVNFDDVVAPSATPITGEYQGLNWSGVSILDSNHFPSSGYANGVVSPDNIAFFYDTATITSGSTMQTFNFHSSYFGSAWLHNQSIDVIGYLGTEVKYSNTITVTYQGSQLFEFDYLGIDRLVLTPYGGNGTSLPGSGNHALMDNFKYTPTPIPGAIWLLGSGLVGLIGLRRRQKA